jgi:hypothetical protein
MYMATKQAILERQFSDLNAAYRTAFHRWVLELHHCQAFPKQETGESGKRQVCDEAAAAESDYRVQRDRLAEFLLTPAPVLAEQTRRRIVRLAYHLWEEAGRPEGTAESDWYRAERMTLRMDTANPS